MVKDGWIEDKKKERERENGRESRSYASWETNRIGYAITLLRTDRRPRGDSFFADIYIYICFFFFFFFSCIKDRFPLFSFLRAIGGNLGDLCFVLFFFFFSCDWSRFIQHDYRIVERKGIVTRDFLPSPLRISNATFLDVNHTIILSLFIGRTEPMLKRCCWFKRKKEREKKKMNKKKKAEETKIFFTRLYL